MFGDELSERKKLILKAIVEAHIECGEPIGSKSLLQLPGINCSSATVRNEMAELEELGYLEQPHTSAGRVPSQLGYRFYVDQLIERYAMTNNEIAQINRILRAKSAELDQILLVASKLASSITNYTGIAVQPKRPSVTISRFSASYIDGQNFVLIMITSLGAVVSKHVRLSTPIPESTVLLLVNALNGYVSGLTADAINVQVIMQLESAMGEFASVINPIIKTVWATLSEYDGGDVKISDVSHLLQYPDYGTPDELADLLDTLEKKDEILKLVSEKEEEDAVSVVIGSESSVNVMSNSSLVFKPVMKDRKVIGVIGVLGPRRMDYAKVLETIETLCSSIASVMSEPLPPGDGGEASDAVTYSGPADGDNIRDKADNGNGK